MYSTHSELNENRDMSLNSGDLRILVACIFTVLTSFIPRTVGDVFTESLVLVFTQSPVLSAVGACKELAAVKQLATYREQVAQMEQLTVQLEARNWVPLPIRVDLTGRFLPILNPI